MKLLRFPNRWIKLFFLLFPLTLLGLLIIETVWHNSGETTACRGCKQHAELATTQDFDQKSWVIDGKSNGRIAIKKTPGPFYATSSGTVDVGGSDHLAMIKERMEAINSEQRVRNADVFGSVLDNSSMLAVIVVQVHNRIQYLRQLIFSFSKAKDIDKTLIVFSHDFWDDEINSLVASVDFVKTMQMFYPYSIQMHPDLFPGQSKDDCPRNAKRQEALKMNCTNADWPDIYGHYREAKFTPTKHHWWWKANRIFNNLTATGDYDGLILFLEEDHYVAEDFLQVLTLLKYERDTNHKDCDIICLGTYLKHSLNVSKYNEVQTKRWVSGEHNMGMAFDRTTWLKIRSCKEVFCKFDDYNWDWSLYHVSLKCFQQQARVMLISGPRVFHIGECGVHHNDWSCSTQKAIDKLTDVLQKAQTYMYPTALHVQVVPTQKPAKVPRGNGGWGDQRDRQMCLAMGNFNSSTMHDLRLLGRRSIIT